VDLYAGDVLALKDDGTVTRTHVSRIVAALRPRHGGGAVLGVERGFALMDADGTIGGPGLDRLYITTSRERLGPGEDPLAGSLFMAEVAVRGQPAREFAG
jgi:hypothetical protein